MCILNIYKAMERKMKSKRLIDFKDAYILVKKYAEDHCEGNFSMAVRKLIKKGVKNAKHDSTKTS
jgi:hypothetical protein